MSKISKTALIQTNTFSKLSHFGTVLATVAVLCATVSGSAIAASTAAGQRLTPVKPTIQPYGNCSKQWLFFPEQDGPAYYFKRTVTVNGGSNQNGVGYLTHTYNSNDVGVFTETAINANDYFVKDGQRVKSVSWTVRAPANVPATCTDWPPVAPNMNAHVTPPTPYTFNVVQNSSDNDDPKSALSAHIVRVANGADEITSLSVVKDANGYDAIRIVPKAGVNNAAIIVAYYVTDSLGIQSDQVQVTLNIQ